MKKKVINSIDKEVLFKFYFFGFGILIIVLHHCQYIDLNNWRFDLLIILGGVVGIVLLCLFVFKDGDTF